MLGLWGDRGSMEGGKLGGLRMLFFDAYVEKDACGEKEYVQASVDCCGGAT